MTPPRKVFSGGATCHHGQKHLDGWSLLVPCCRLFQHVGCLQ